MTPPLTSVSPYQSVRTWRSGRAARVADHQTPRIVALIGRVEPALAAQGRRPLSSALELVNAGSRWPARAGQPGCSVSFAWTWGIDFPPWP